MLHNLFLWIITDPFLLFYTIFPDHLKSPGAAALFYKIESAEKFLDHYFTHKIQSLSAVISPHMQIIADLLFSCF